MSSKDGVVAVNARNLQRLTISSVCADRVYPVGLHAGLALVNFDYMRSK
jgi:hypothetical protein